MSELHYDSVYYEEYSDEWEEYYNFLGVVVPLVLVLWTSYYLLTTMNVGIQIVEDFCYYFGITSQKSRKKKKTSKHSKSSPSHPWQLTKVKAHENVINSMSVSPDGKYLATCSTDKTIRIWNIGSIAERKRSKRESIKHTMEFDTAYIVAWAPQSRKLYIPQRSSYTVEMYKLKKNGNGRLMKLDRFCSLQCIDKTTARAILIPSTGKYIMSIHQKGEVVIWDDKGETGSFVLKALNKVMGARMTQDDEYIILLDYEEGITQWKITENAKGDFADMVLIWIICRQPRHIYSFDVSLDGKNVVVLSGKYVWEMFSISEALAIPLKRANIEWRGKPRNFLIRISPDTNVVAIAMDNQVLFYSVNREQLLRIVSNIQSEWITDLKFTLGNSYWVVSGDKYLRTFPNVCGWEESVRIIEEQLKNKYISATKTNQLHLEKREYLNRLYNVDQKIRTKLIF